MQGAKPLAKINENSPPSHGEGGRGDGDKKYRYAIGKEGIARKAGACYLNCNEILPVCPATYHAGAEGDRYPAHSYLYYNTFRVLMQVLF